MIESEARPQLSGKTKTWRVARYFLFAFLYAGLEVALIRVPFIYHLAEAAHTNDLIALACAMGMTLALMLAILYGGMNFNDLTAEWKPQLYGAFAFFWSLDTCRTIGYVCFRYFASNSQDEGTLFMYFFLGLLILLPFEFVALMAHRKRLGLPTWPNLPKQ